MMMLPGAKPGTKGASPGKHRMSVITIVPNSDGNDLALRLLRQKQIDEKDVVGANVVGEGKVSIIVYSYPLVKHRRTATITEIGQCATPEDALLLCLAIKRVSGIPTKERNMITIINPVAGKGLAQEVWQQYCIELLSKHANINFKNENVIVTSRANEATDVIKRWDLSDIDGILVVGGDGTMYEAIQGLLQRSDFNSVRNIPLALISGGSGNAWSCSVLYLSGMDKGLKDLRTTATNMAFIVARGNIKPLDLSVAENFSRGKMYSFLSLNWG